MEKLAFALFAVGCLNAFWSDCVLKKIKGQVLMGMGLVSLSLQESPVMESLKSPILIFSSLVFIYSFITLGLYLRTPEHTKLEGLDDFDD